jgi:hypothetical protein
MSQLKICGWVIVSLVAGITAGIFHWNIGGVFQTLLGIYAIVCGIVGLTMIRSDRHRLCEDLHAWGGIMLGIGNIFFYIPISTILFSAIALLLERLIRAERVTLMIAFQCSLGIITLYYLAKRGAGIILIGLVALGFAIILS